MEDRIAKLETKAHVMNYELNTLKEIERSNAGSLKVIEASIVTAVGELRDGQAHNDRRLDRIEQITTEANDRLNGLVDIVNAIEDRLTTRIDGVEGKIDRVEQSLNTRIDGVEGKIDRVEQSLNTRIDGVEGKIDRVEQSLNTRIDRLESMMQEVLDRLPPKPNT